MASGNLEFIKSASGTSVTSLDVTNCFSDTYDVYAIKLDADGYNANSLLTLQLIDNTDTTISTTSYDNASLNMRTDAAYNELRTTGDTVLLNRVLGFFDYNNGAREGGSAIIYIFNPYSSSSYTFATCQSSSQFKTGQMTGQKGIGVLKTTDVITGFHITQDGYTATYSDINASVFGVR